MTLIDMDNYKEYGRSYFDLLEKERLFIRANLESIIKKSLKAYQRRESRIFSNNMCRFSITRGKMYRIWELDFDWKKV
ncbi:hypothetical protein [Enterococcus faecalis]|uniref:hypothetical protein n=1 Tax=Enterococcus faecalis TaxID=1351 RepID=UPI001C61507A|nr:hypothetical protein [Enterococcus faecalis]